MDFEDTQYWDEHEEEFEPLILQKKCFLENSGYKVYRNAKDFVIVDAKIVSQAIEKSGINEPYKIERIGIRLANVIPESLLSSVEKNENPNDFTQGNEISGQNAES